MMWRMVWIFLGLAGLGAVFSGVVILVNIAATGQFSTLKPQAIQNCREVRGLTGVEDLVIDRTSGLVFYSVDDRQEKRSGPAPAKPGIYVGLYDRDSIRPQLLTGTLVAFHPHGLSLHVDAQGRKTLAVVSHPQKGQSQIHLFDVLESRPNGGAPVVSLKEREVLANPLMPSANDVHLVSANQFYVTVDVGSVTRFGALLETLFFLPRSSIVFYDGTSWSQAADRLTYANGINGSIDGKVIYVAETLGMNLNIFDRDGDGRLTKQRALYLGTALDNIDVDESGALWVTAHPHLLDFVSHARNVASLSPSQIIKVTANAQGGGEARQVYLNDGSEISGASVAAVHRGRMVVGSVFEDHILNCPAP